MKYVKMLLLGALLVLSGCSSMGPSVKDLDTMNKKVTYMYHQAGAVIEGFNNLVAAKVLIPGSKSFEKVDKVIQEMYKAVEAMESARSLEEMIRMEANAISVLSTMRSLLVELAKEGVKTDAKCNLCVGPTYQWSYS